MSFIEKKQEQVFIKKQKCTIKFPNTTKIQLFSVVFYGNRKIQFFPLSQNYEIPPKQNGKVPQLELKRKNITQIQLNTSYRIRLQISILQSGNKKAIYSDEPHPYLVLKIKNYLKSEKYSIQFLQNSLQELSVSDKKNQFKKLQQYFKGFVWIKKQNKKQYECIQQIPSEVETNGVKGTKFLLMRDRTTFQKYFVKSYLKRELINKQTGQLDIKPLISEIYFQNIVKHKNIMRFNQFFEEQNCFLLFYSQKPIKILSRYNKQCSQLFPTEINIILKHTLQAVKQLQNSKIIHNNIRPSSIFIIQTNNRLKICLGEFQKANFVNSKHMFATKKQQIKYLSPQLIKGNKFYGKLKTHSDIFNLGILFYQLQFKKQLFENATMLSRIQNDKINFSSKQFKLMPKQNFDFFSKMIEYDPESRISANQALQDEYFARNQENQQQNQFLDILKNDLMNQQFYSMQQRGPMHSNNDVRFTENRNRQHALTNIVKPLKKSYEQEKSPSKLGEIDENFMDDSHKQLFPRDIRIMKPSMQMLKRNFN